MFAGALLAVVALGSDSHDGISDVPAFLRITTWPPKKEQSSWSYVAAQGYLADGSLDTRSFPESCQLSSASQTEFYPSKEEIDALASPNAHNPVVQQLIIDAKQYSGPDESPQCQYSAKMSHPTSFFSSDDWGIFNADDYELTSTFTRKSLDYMIQQMSKLPEIQEYVKYQHDMCVQHQLGMHGNQGARLAEYYCPKPLEDGRTLAPSKVIADAIASNGNILWNGQYTFFDDLVEKDWMLLVFYLAMRHSAPTKLNLFCSVLNPKDIDASFTVHYDKSSQPKYQPGRCTELVPCDHNTLEFRWGDSPPDDVFRENFTQSVQIMGDKIPVWLLFNSSDSDVLEAADRQKLISLFTISADAKGDSRVFDNEYDMEQLKLARAKFKVSANLFCLNLAEAVSYAGHANAPADTTIMKLCHRSNACTSTIPNPRPKDYANFEEAWDKCCYFSGGQFRDRKWWMEEGKNESDLPLVIEAHSLIPDFTKLHDLSWNRTYAGEFTWTDLSDNGFRMTFQQSGYPQNAASRLLPSNLKTISNLTHETINETVGFFRRQPDGTSCMYRVVTMSAPSDVNASDIKRWQTIFFISPPGNQLEEITVDTLTDSESSNVTFGESSNTSFQFVNMEIKTGQISPATNKPELKTDSKVSGEVEPALVSSSTESSTRWWVIALFGLVLVAGGAAVYRYKKNMGKAQNFTRTVQYRKMSQS